MNWTMNESIHQFFWNLGEFMGVDPALSFCLLGCTVWERWPSLCKKCKHKRDKADLNWSYCWKFLVWHNFWFCVLPVFWACLKLVIPVQVGWRRYFDLNSRKTKCPLKYFDFWPTLGKVDCQPNDVLPQFHYLIHLKKTVPFQYLVNTVIKIPVITTYQNIV